MKTILKILTFLCVCAILHSPVSTFAQDQTGHPSRSGNPLRLIASTPLADPQTREIRVPEHSDEEYQNSQSGIPPEIEQALYPTQNPSQRHSKTVTVTVDDSMEAESPIVQANSVPPPVQIQSPATEIRTGQAAVGTPASSQPNTTEPAKAYPVQQANFDQTPDKSTAFSGKTLSELLAESNPQTSPRRAANGAEFAVNEASSHLDQSNSSPGNVDIVALLKKIITSTCVVLFLGVGFILVAKRWFNAKEQLTSTNRNRLTQTNRASPPKIRIVSSLKLNGKANLHLVEVGEQRVLIAADLNGIKSVTPLNQSFSTTLDALENEAESSEIDGSSQSPESRNAGTYTPAARVYAEPNRSATDRPVYPPDDAVSQDKQKQPKPEIEAEMKRQLAELLGGQAFSDVFYKQTRAVA